jgi:mycothiol synthase
MSAYRIQERYAEEYLSQLTELAQEVEAADHHRALEDHRWIDLASGGKRSVAGLVAIWERTETVVGYLRLSKGRKGYEFELLIKPALRDRADLDLMGDLLGAGVERARTEGEPRATLWLPNPSEKTVSKLADLGFTPDREVLQMRRPLPLDPQLTSPLPPLRHFVVGKDEQAWLELNNRAFEWHPDQGDWDLETIKEREREPWFSEEDFLMLEASGRLVGFCWTKVHSDLKHPVGEIYVIAVDPDESGKGYGKGLLFAGLDHLATKRGLDEAMLYVEAQNVTARKLYEQFGFRLDHVDRRFTCDLGRSLDRNRLKYQFD